MRIHRAVVAITGIVIATIASADSFQKGLDAYNSADYETALAIWQPLAEAGDVGSQYGLGMMYGNGFGVMMDDALAIKWYALAAEKGHADAQCKLAVMYQNGWGVPPSEEEAMRLYALAADQGVGEAMLALGRHYSMDFSDAYDPVQAYKWFALAAMVGEFDAPAKRDMVADKMTPEQIAEAKSLVESWSNGHAKLLAQQ